MQYSVDTIIVGAGPYGLSIAAHLHAANISVRVFGKPMNTWREHMPDNMLLKSDGFASNLYEPTGTFTLKCFCKSHSLPYHDVNLPVSLETFVKYGLEFQRRFVPDLDERSVTAVDVHSPGFKVTLSDGQELISRHLILAAGVTHFSYMPDDRAVLPKHLASHSSPYTSLKKFANRHVTVLGGGASAIDLAVLLHEAGAKVNLVARRRTIRFHNPPALKRRNLWQRVRTPASGLGPGLKSRFFCEAPGVFRHFPFKRRLQIVERHLGPAPGWPMRDRLMGKVSMNLGVRSLRAQPAGEGLCLTFIDESGTQREQLTDHVIAATGYRVDVNRLHFVSRDIRQRMHIEGTSPKLSANFESSVPGLYLVGIAAAISFGPLMRFAFGAKYASRRITGHLLKGSSIIEHHRAVTIALK